MTRPAVDPADIQSHVLQDGDVRVSVLSIGAVVQSWEVAGVPVVLGYADPADYIDNPGCMGAIMGRVANRTAFSRFDLDGQAIDLAPNDGPHHLHGGPGGLGWRNWQMTPEGPRAVTLRLTSEDGDQGYPGRVDFAVRMTLEGHRLRWRMTAVPDRPTPVNMCQHVYFNLMGAGDVRDHVLHIPARGWTPTSPDLIPLGRIDPVEGTIYDFRSPSRIGDVAPPDQTHDANLALALDQSGEDPAVTLRAPSGMTLRMWTGQPGLQLYTCGMLTPRGTPLPGPAHGRWAAVVLEAQGFPNALNEPGFGSLICSPDAPYEQILDIDIAPEAV